MESIKKELEKLQAIIFEREQDNKKIVETDEVRKYIERKCLLDYFLSEKIQKTKNVINSDLIDLMLEIDNLTTLKNVKRYIYNINTLKFFYDVRKILLEQYKLNNCNHVWYVMGENKQDKICKCLLCKKEEQQNKVIFSGQIEGKTYLETEKEYAHYLNKYHKLKKECVNDEIVKKLIMKKRI